MYADLSTNVWHARRCTETSDEHVKIAHHASFGLDSRITGSIKSQAAESRSGLCCQKGDYERAIADFDQSIRLKPDWAVAYDNRGLAYALKGDYDRAIADFTQAIKLEPDLAVAYLLRGMVYADTGEREKAIADLEKALELGLNPNQKQQAEALLKKLK